MVVQQQRSEARHQINRTLVMKKNCNVTRAANPSALKLQVNNEGQIWEFK
jgi:hypothetical protein